MDFLALKRSDIYYTPPDKERNGILYSPAQTALPNKQFFKTHFEKPLVFGGPKRDTTPQQAYIQANCGKQRGQE
jgi:hypothetical protein